MKKIEFPETALQQFEDICKKEISMTKHMADCIKTTTTKTYKECPNGCSSAGEVWDGEGLILCPTCKGATTADK